jgi:hypothetical protein
VKSKGSRAIARSQTVGGGDHRPNAIARGLHAFQFASATLSRKSPAPKCAFRAAMLSLHWEGPPRNGASHARGCTEAADAELTGVLAGTGLRAE